MKKFFLCISFLCSLDAHGEDPCAYVDQKDLNHTVAKIVTTFAHQKQQNIRYGTHNHWPVTTDCELWEKTYYAWQDFEGKPVEHAPGKQVLEPTIALRDPSTSFSKALKGLLESHITMECRSARIVLAHYTLMHLLGEEKYDAYARSYIQEHDRESAFLYMVESLWMDSKQREIGAFSYIPNIKNYTSYRNDGPLQGENVVMVCQELLPNGSFLNLYVCLPADGNSGFEVRDDTEILLSFRDDLQKSKELQQEELEWRRCHRSSLDEGTDYNLSIEFIDTVKGLSEYQKEYYSQNLDHDHHYFDVEKINRLLQTPTQDIISY